MPAHDFAPLYAHYPAVIEDMDPTFTSHKFILELAHRHQALYADALHTYRDTLYGVTPAPFMVVHGILSKHLITMSDRVRYAGQAQSEDIFRQSNECAQWQKVATTSAS